jgi:hypothetical protein
MEKSNFKLLVAKMEQLTENEQGTLKGGFSLVSGIDADLADGTTNNCNCKNKNRGKTCTGCAAQMQ